MKLALILTVLAVLAITSHAGPAHAPVEDAAPPKESSGNEAAAAPASSDYAYGAYGGFGFGGF